MAYNYPPSMETLIAALAKLPGVGQKTATRLGVFLLNDTKGYAEQLSESLLNAKNTVRHCDICGNLTDENLCSVCSDTRRDRSRICVVEQPADALVIDRTGEFFGLYHILHGALSPMNGVGPEDLNLNPLLERLREGDVAEVILATNTSIEGEATALYLARLIRPLGINATRIAYGVSVGSDLEYTDQLTLSRALADRKPL